MSNEQDKELTKKEELTKEDLTKELAICHRRMLRLLVEYNNCSVAQKKLGYQASINDIVTQDVFLAELQDFISFTIDVAKKIGNPDKVKDHLQEHREEDAKHLSKLKPEIGDLIANLASKLAKPCLDCGKPMCISCNTCHPCEDNKEKDEFMH